MIWVEKVRYRVQVVASDPIEAERLAWEAADAGEHLGGVIDDGSIRIRRVTDKED